MSPKKQLIAMRASDLTIRQLAELVKVLGMNQSEVLTLAIDRLYTSEVTKGQPAQPDSPAS